MIRVTEVMMRSVLLTMLLLTCSTSALWTPPWRVVSRPGTGCRGPGCQTGALNVPRVPGVGRRSSQHTKEGGWRMEAVSGRSGDLGRHNSGTYHAEALVNGIPYSRAGYRGTARLYSVQVPEAGAGYLNIMANGGQGDVDLYVRYAEYPTKRSYDQRSATPGNQEQVIIERPAQGTYYIVLYGYENYSDVGFEAESR